MADTMDIGEREYSTPSMASGVDWFTQVRSSALSCHTLLSGMAQRQATFIDFTLCAFTLPPAR